MVDSFSVPAGVSVPGYQINGVISAGKVATLYNVTEEKSGRPFAMKLFRPIKSSPTRLMRFNLEAELLSTLSHKGIAILHKTGSLQTGEGECFYHVLDLVEGRPLPDYLESANPSLDDRLEMLCEIADIVEYVHGRGVLHRNLKPDNILIDKDGGPRLIDFGLARIKEGEQKITAPGQIIGTLSYMAPEQARGKSEDLDERVDVYSLAAVGYTMIADRAPLDLHEQNLYGALNIIQNTDPIPLGQINPALSGEIERIFLKALSKNPDDRYGSVWAFASELREYLAEATMG